LALAPLSRINVPPELVTFTTEHLAEELRSRGFRVTTSEDIATILGMERQKQLLGCVDSGSSCLMELANALGVDAVVAGQFGKLGGPYQLDLRVLAARDGVRLAGWSSSLADEAHLLPALKKAGDALASQLRLSAQGPTVAQGVVQPPSSQPETPSL